MPDCTEENTCFLLLRHEIGYFLRMPQCTLDCPKCYTSWSGLALVMPCVAPMHFICKTVSAADAGLSFF